MISAVPCPSSPCYYEPMPLSPAQLQEIASRRPSIAPAPTGPPHEPWTFWERLVWLLVIAAVAFIAGVQIGRREERADMKARVAEFRAEQARPAEVSDVP